MMGKDATPKKISSSTVAIAFRRPRRALEVARINEIIAKNPAEGISISTSESEREHVILEPEQIMLFLAAWAGRRLYALYAVHVTAGLRRGEVLGLRWKDIDIDE
jgi:integrase